MTEISNLYLPLTDDQARSLLLGSLAQNECSKWSVAEYAAIFVILSAANPKTRHAYCRRFMCEIFNAGIEIEKTGDSGAFYQVLIQRFDLEAFAKGYDRLVELHIRLMDEETLEKRRYILADGTWDTEFSRRRDEELTPFKHKVNTPGGNEVVLSDSLARAYGVLRTELDESFHLQALAGTGKTFLVERLVDLLDGYHPLVLALTKVQLNAVMERIGRYRANGMMFNEFAFQALQSDVSCPPRLRWREASKNKVPESQVASEMQFMEVAGLQPPQVAYLALQIVTRYCASADADFNERHIPSMRRYADQDRCVLIEYARMLWDEIRTPVRLTKKLPLYGYHLIKQLSLSVEAMVIPGYSHIIVDEAHDMPIPLLQFLSRSSTPIITLGDACQRLDGQVAQPGANVRRRELFHSVRAGQQIESAINALLINNPLVQVHPMVGSKIRDTRTVYYDNLDLPDDRSTILVGSDWALFEYCQRLASVGASFSLLPGSSNNFHQFVAACISLYTHNIRPAYAPMFKYRSWEQIRQEKGDTDPAFTRIDRMFQKGYCEANYSELLRNLVELPKAKYLVGLVRDAKNMEFDSVMLTPDLFPSQLISDRSRIAQRFANIYTGGTRARYRLYVPGHIREWAQEQGSAV